MNITRRRCSEQNTRVLRLGKRASHARTPLFFAVPVEHDASLPFQGNVLLTPRSFQKPPPRGLHVRQLSRVLRENAEEPCTQSRPLLVQRSSLIIHFITHRSRVQASFTRSHIPSYLCSEQEPQLMCGEDYMGRC